MAKERKDHLLKNWGRMELKAFFTFIFFRVFSIWKLFLPEKLFRKAGNGRQRSQTYCYHRIIHSALHLCSLWVSGGKESGWTPAHLPCIVKKSAPNVCLTNGVSETSLLSVKYEMTMIIIVTKNTALQSWCLLSESHGLETDTPN